MPIVFVEAVLGDTSEFEHLPLIEVIEEDGRFVLRLLRCVSIAHALAAVALELSKTGKPPEIHFGWSDENPLAANLGFLLFGEGNVPWLVRNLIQRRRTGFEEAAAGDYRLKSPTHAATSSKFAKAASTAASDASSAVELSLVDAVCRP